MLVSAALQGESATQIHVSTLLKTLLSQSSLQSPEWSSLRCIAGP